MGSGSTLRWQRRAFYEACQFHHDCTSTSAASQQQRARGRLADRTALPSAKLPGSEWVRVARLLVRIDLGRSTNGISYWWERGSTSQWSLGRTWKKAADLGVLS